MKDVLLLHDNARPHTSLRKREAIPKMGRTVLPHNAHTPDLALSDYHLFGPVNNALRGSHFADDNELKQRFRDAPRSRVMGYYNTGVQRLTQRWPKRVEKDGYFVKKWPYNCKR
jgi:histone-lysine N-methyltransferase SETMAR